MSEKKSIAILGAGYGGVHAAKLLYKHLKGKNIQIQIIDKKPYHTLMTELHEVAGSRVEPDAVQIRLNRIFEGTSVEIVTDEIERVNFSEQTLYSNSSSYKYDYMILDAGAEPAYFGVPGVKENSLTIWSLEDALKIREHIQRMFEAAELEKDFIKRKRLLTFVVAGAGFTGIEVIGELAEWVKHLCEIHDIERKNVSLIVVEAMKSILPVLSDRLAKKSEKYLARKNVKLIVEAPIVKADEDSVTLKDGTVIGTNTLIWTCGVQGSSFSANLGLTLGKRGRVQTNDYMQAMDYKNVYVIGDNAYYEEDGVPLPQIVETALQTAETAGKNIIADITGREKIKLKTKYHGIMVSIGSRDAVANVGGISTSGFMAMATKHLVNLHYLYGVGGFRTIMAYIMHEFFDIRHNRSLIGGHMSNKAPIFWLAIIRVYLGFIWLFEGINKIRDGWLDPARNFIVTMPQVTDVPQETASAVTGATQVTQYLPQPLLKRPPAIYEWFMDTFISPNAHLFQIFIVFTEIAIGLALIVGLFTLLASAASIFLCFNFILSAMAGKEILWHFFVGLALLGGAGRAFGLDYYVMPWLKRWWKHTAVARKLHLYVE